MKEATECRTPGNAEIVWTAAGITLAVDGVHWVDSGGNPTPPQTPYPGSSGTQVNSVNEHYLSGL